MADPRPGPLAAFVRAGASRQLQQYLLLVALATAEPYDVARGAPIWHRALGFSETDHPSSVLSKGWRWLTDANLICPGRRGRLSAPTLLREDGTGETYVPPDGGEVIDRYFQVPFQYWLDDPPWYRVLSLAETAMLLIALSLPDGFILPVAKAPVWYGVSKHTAQRGLDGLYKRKLLDRRLDWKETTFVDSFYAQERFWTLKRPFGPKGRAASYKRVTPS